MLLADIAYLMSLVPYVLSPSSASTESAVDGVTVYTQAEEGPHASSEVLLASHLSNPYRWWATTVN
jgi:hypothetical protein